MLLQELREKIVEIGNRMVEDGVAHGSQGNISAYDVESGLIAITPSAVPYRLRKAEDITVIDMDRKIVEGKWRPTSEIALHMIFYKRRKDVKAVVHSHAPHSTVFGVIHESVPSILTEAALCLTGPVPVAPYFRPGTEEVAELTYNAMGENGAAGILAHHGLVTVAGNLEQAYDSTMAAETTARIVIMARSMGAKEINLDPAEAAAMREIYLTKYFAKPLGQ
jgi:L-ribulose-5-phosphate 4-epimerase